jgi:hypothetical protein
VTDSDSDDALRMAPLLDKVFAAAQPGLVFSAPVVAGAYTIITASEVMAGGGFGVGGGSDQSPTDNTTTAGGHGGGGGGGASARPVAAIVIGPDGVKVKPIFDITKVALAGITAGGANGDHGGTHGRRQPEAHRTVTHFRASTEHPRCSETVPLVWEDRRVVTCNTIATQVQVMSSTR